MSVLCVVLLALWMSARSDAMALTQDVLFDREETEDGGLARWRGTGALAMRWRDADGNGVREEWASYNRLGELTSRWSDGNQNGIPERLDRFDAKGRRVVQCLDEDEDGRFEKTVMFYEAGSRAVCHDLNGDGVFEMREVYDAAGGKLFGEEDRGRDGHVRR